MNDHLIKRTNDRMKQTKQLRDDIIYFLNHKKSKLTPTELERILDIILESR